MKHKVFLLASALAILPAWRAQARTVIGILEHPQCVESDRIAVRALFEKSDGHWAALGTRESLDSVIPGEMAWTIAFDGRRLGTVQTTVSRPDVPDDWTFKRDMLLEVAPAQNPPAIMNRKKQFGGWCDSPLHRPLVLVSGGSFEDPEVWRSYAPDSTLRRSLFPAFRRSEDSVYFCPKDPEKAVRFDFTWRDLRIVAGYRNRARLMLLAVELDPRGGECDYMAEAAWDLHWFLLGDEPVLVGRSLELVDAGDFDGDGRSELLFWHSGYNEDGYTLYYDGLRKHVDYWWSYH